MELDRLVQAIRDDNRAGATELTRRAADLMLREIGGDHLSPADFRKALAALGKALMAAQPTMASIFNMVNSLLLTLKETELEPLKQISREEVADFLTRLKSNNRALAHHAGAFIQEGYTVLTHSYSSSVAAALEVAHAEGKQFQLIVTESRPILEGRDLATRLTSKGLSVKLVADSAAFRCLPQAQVVFVGADSVASQGVINKVGTWGLALAAKELAIPFYVLATSEKVVPAEFPFALKEEPGNPKEVWDNPPAGLEVINLYYDLTPLELVTAVVSEEGGRKPAQIIESAQGPAVFPDLI